jgi:hypothetical protein
VDDPQYGDFVEVLDGPRTGERGRVCCKYTTNKLPGWYEVDVLFSLSGEKQRYHSFSLRVVTILDLLAEV